MISAGSALDLVDRDRSFRQTSMSSVRSISPNRCTRLHERIVVVDDQIMKDQDTRRRAAGPERYRALPAEARPGGIIGDAQAKSRPLTAPPTATVWPAALGPNTSSHTAELMMLPGTSRRYPPAAVA
jgi:hypothetical protein